MKIRMIGYSVNNKEILAFNKMSGHSVVEDDITGHEGAKILLRSASMART